MKKKILIVLLCLLSLSCTRKANHAINMYVGDIREDTAVFADEKKRLNDYHAFENNYQRIHGQATTLVLRVESGASTFKEVVPEISILNNWIDEYNSNANSYDKSFWKSKSLPNEIQRVSSYETLKDLAK